MTRAVHVSLGACVALACIVGVASDEAGYSIVGDRVHQKMSKWAVNAGGMALVKQSPRPSDIFVKNAVLKADVEAGTEWNDAPDKGVLQNRADKNFYDNGARYVWDSKVKSKPLRGLHKRKGHKLMRKVVALRDGRRVVREYVRTDEISLGQRMHHYDLQVLHAKPPCSLLNTMSMRAKTMNNMCVRLTNAEVRDLIVDQAAVLFLRGCVNKVATRVAPHTRWGSQMIGTAAYRRGQRDRSIARAMTAHGRALSFLSTVEMYHARRRKESDTPDGEHLHAPLLHELNAATVADGDFFLGTIFHMIEDSFAAGHAARRRGPSGRAQEGDIIYFQDTSSQDLDKHKKADVGMCKKEFERYATCTETAESGIVRPAVKVKWPCQEGKDYLESLNKCILKKTGVPQIPQSPKRTSGWQRAVDLLGIDGDGGDSSPAPPFSVWASAPGAIAAARAAAKITAIYRATTHSDAVGKIAKDRDYASLREACVDGADALAGYLEQDVLFLENPADFAGGSAVAFKTATCPRVSRVLNSLERYTDWDRSVEKRISRFVRDIAAETVNALTTPFKKLNSNLRGLLPRHGTELSCSIKCEKRIKGLARFGIACLDSSVATESARVTHRHGRGGGLRDGVTWSLKCCVDMDVSDKVGEPVRDGEDGAMKDHLSDLMGRLLYNRRDDDENDVRVPYRSPKKSVRRGSIKRKSEKKDK